MHRIAEKSPLLVCALLWLGTQSALADPYESLLTTYTHNGAHQIDVAMGSQKPSGQGSSSAGAIGIGYLATDRWFTELYGSYAHAAGEATQFDSAAWINTLVLTGGQSPVDVGIYSEIEYEQDRAAGYKIQIGPLLQAEFGLTTVNLNFLLHRNYLADFSNTMQFDYQWQVKRRWNAALEYGIQGFGELGAWNHWAPHDQQAHRIGPVLLGSVALPGESIIHYNAGVLFDAFDGQHAVTLRLQATYGF